jgi:hypothetical protein
VLEGLLRALRRRARNLCLRRKEGRALGGMRKKAENWGRE